MYRQHLSASFKKLQRKMKQTEREKCIGTVKWFRDQTKNTNIGFIQHSILGELFFHENNIEQGQDTSLFKENEVVVFIPQESSKHKGKLEAVQVKLLSTEIDLNFLFTHFLSILTERGKSPGVNHIQISVDSRITSLLKRIEDQKINDELFYRYESFVNIQLQSLEGHDPEFLQGTFNACKDFFPDKYSDFSGKVELIISKETAHSLWIAKCIENCQVDYISGIITLADKNTQITIFNRCSEEDKLNIFFRVIYYFEYIDTETKLETIKDILKLSKEFAYNQHDKIAKEILKICPVYYKLILWLEDLHQELNFEEYKMFTITLKPSDQVKFVKKVLKYIHDKKAEITIEELTSINIIDYETSKVAENIDNSKLDFSTSIILNTILELNNQIQIETSKQKREANNRIFDIILAQIKEPTDILEIKGFFDECEGRCYVSINEIKDEGGKVIDKEVTYHRNEHDKPKHHPICDGRKSLLNETKSIIAEETGMEFWWCANQKCYEPSRKLHKSDEWEKYTLLDFLTILKVPFKEKDYEIYLNLIIKANRFFKHLKCRKCNHILTPLRQANYAFYGVNDFHCTNESCGQKGNRIYLTHCLNGKCEQIIDSRDSVKCKPEGFESEKYGWFICNYCYACCSDQAIINRKNNLKQNGQEYKGHTKGHRDNGIICCNKCGNAMGQKEVDTERYENALNWFISNSNNPKYIKKSGENKKNKHWFRFAKADLSTEVYNQKLHNLLILGFLIPNINENRSVQLIAEPNNILNRLKEILTCNNCGNVFDLSNDIERAVAIKSFQNVRFDRTITEDKTEKLTETDQEKSPDM